VLANLKVLEVNALAFAQPQQLGAEAFFLGRAPVQDRVLGRAGVHADDPKRRNALAVELDLIRRIDKKKTKVRVCLRQWEYE